jgi:homoserine O-succinyltransferase
MPTCDHPLTRGFLPSSPIPHSRWNDLPEKELRDAGYRVLSWSPEAGVDAFAKQNKSLMVFLQGHPEYEARTLLIEYRRDVGRYLRGERDTYPQMPAAYFGAETRDALTAFQERARAGRREELVAQFPAELAERTLANRWHATAARLYRNWLMYLCEQKEQRLKLRRGHAGMAAERELSLPQRFASGL